MKKWTALIYIFFILGTGCNTQAIASIQTIVFLRHGEKPRYDFGQLTCQGLNRALALPEVLVKKFGKPDYIFAPNPYFRGIYYYVRALTTIEPMAISLGLPVQTQYQFYHDDALIKELLSPKYHRSVIFICWEHLYIIRIAKKIMSTLKANPDDIPWWSENDFDSLYVIKIDWVTKRPIVKFIHDQERLNNQSRHCPKPPETKNITQTGNFYQLTFVLVPTAEKLNHTDQLTCQGLNRAIALAYRLEQLYPSIEYFMLPSATSQSFTLTISKFNFLQSLMTIEPTIIYRGSYFIPLVYKISEAVKQIQTTMAFKTTAVITWPTEEMPRLARKLYASYGGDPTVIPDTAPSSNTIYQIIVKYGWPIQKPEFSMIQEHLNEQSLICPGSLQ